MGQKYIEAYKHYGFHRLVVNIKINWGMFYSGNTP